MKNDKLTPEEIDLMIDESPWVPIKENYDIWDFEKNPKLVGRFESENILEGAGVKGTDLNVLVFKTARKQLVSMVRGGVLQNIDFAINLWYCIEFKGVKETKEGNKVNIFDVHEIKFADEQLKQINENLDS